MKLFTSLAIATAIGSVANASVLTQWNLVVTGNHFLQSDVEGRAFIGGNLSGNGDFASKLTPELDFLGVDTLVVAGNMTVNNIQLQAGNLRLGGTRTGNINFNGGGTQISDPTLPTQASAIATELASTSQFLRNLPANSTASIQANQPNQPGPLVFNAVPGPNGVAVFSISAALLSSNLVQSLQLNINGATSIIVNVSGASAGFTTGNLVDSWTSTFARTKALWNFHEATTLNVQRNVYGAVLAPQAHLSNNSNIDGSVFVRSFTQNGEVHLPTYTGFIPAPGAVVLASLSGLLLVRRRRA